MNRADQFPIDFKSLLITEILRQKNVLKGAKVLIGDISLELLIVKTFIDKYEATTVKMILEHDKELANNLRNDNFMVYDQLLEKKSGLDLNTLISRWKERLLNKEYCSYNEFGHSIYSPTMGITNNYPIHPKYYTFVYPNRWEQLALLVAGIYWDISDKPFQPTHGN